MIVDIEEDERERLETVALGQLVLLFAVLAAVAVYLLIVLPV